MDNDCDGCYTLSSDCYYSEIEGCPCRICLIKVMCEKACEYLNIHLKRVDKMYGASREILS